LVVEKRKWQLKNVLKWLFTLCSMNGFLTYGQVKAYKRKHKSIRDQKKANRIKAILMLNSGYSQREIAEVLLLDESTIWRWYDIFKLKGIKILLKDNYKGGTTKLTEDQIVELDEHLFHKVYLTSKEIRAYILDKYGVHYTIKGVTSLLHRMDYSYKKPKQVPGKANKEDQEAFIKQYEKLKRDKAPEDQIYFADGSHPLHNSQPAYGWMKKDFDYTIKSNTGRQRVNINGAINIQNLELEYRLDETIDSDSAINLFEQILSTQKKGIVYVIVDNARYYKSRKVADFVLENPRLVIIYLPPYSPNLNIIERLWRFLRKNITYNKYYEKFTIFREVIIEFLENIDKHRAELQTLLVDNFEIIETA
jgi:transposase